MYELIKEEINHLLDAGFIRSCRYAEWISNIVPVEKKHSGKIKVCIDFRDLNKTTPKDEYPMSIADMLINLLLDIVLSVFLMVMRVIIKYSCLKRIRLKRPLDVLVSLSGLL